MMGIKLQFQKPIFCSIYLFAYHKHQKENKRIKILNESKKIKYLNFQIDLSRVLMKGSVMKRRKNIPSKGRVENIKLSICRDRCE